MKHSHLQEFSKFLSGVIAADFFVGAWLYFADMLPIKFAGITFTPEATIIGMVFDVIFFLFLIHYGWHFKVPSPSIHRKPLLYTVGVLLGIVAILHLLRLIFGIDIQIGTWQAPIWLSWLGTIVTGYLSYASLKFAGHK